MKHTNPKLHFQTIVETNKYRVDYSYESTFLIDKLTNRIVCEDDFYGDPECGLIDEDNNWILVGGTHLLLWKPKLIRRFQSEEFENVHSMRTKNKNTIEILIDPWSENSSIWELNIQSERLTKICDFDVYRDKEITDNVNW